MSRFANAYTKPILKWAGGKSQMLGEIIPRMPKEYNSYIEPFFGSGALYFAIAPQHAIIADSNPELINLYQVIAEEPEGFINELNTFENTEEMFYSVREKNWNTLSPLKAAARTVYLNKTCFNGLYRVNKEGRFNTPYANNKRNSFCDADEIRKAAKILKNAEIICGDYHDVLISKAQEGDFVFLDPPYVPVSKYADFKRYTKEQFNEEDQRRLAEDVRCLSQKGCNIMLTNSNHPLVYELYGQHHIEVFQTRRMINKDANNRTGEDVIVTTYKSAA